MTQDCRNSDLPAPVVPPTRACGPSDRMSTENVPWLDWPTMARRLPGLARQHGRGEGPGEDGARLAPLLDDGLLGAGEVGAREREQRDGAR